METSGAVNADAQMAAEAAEICSALDGFVHSSLITRIARVLSASDCDSVHVTMIREKIATVSLDAWLESAERDISGNRSSAIVDRFLRRPPHSEIARDATIALAEYLGDAVLLLLESPTALDMFVGMFARMRVLLEPFVRTLSEKLLPVAFCCSDAAWERLGSVNWRPTLDCLEKEFARIIASGDVVRFPLALKRVCPLGITSYWLNQVLHRGRIQFVHALCDHYVTWKTFREHWNECLYSMMELLRRKPVQLVAFFIRLQAEDWIFENLAANLSTTGVKSRSKVLLALAQFGKLADVSCETLARLAGGLLRDGHAPTATAVVLCALADKSTYASTTTCAVTASVQTVLKHAALEKSRESVSYMSLDAIMNSCIDAGELTTDVMRRFLELSPERDLDCLCLALVRAGKLADNGVAFQAQFEKLMDLMALARQLNPHMPLRVSTVSTETESDTARQLAALAALPCDEFTQRVPIRLSDEMAAMLLAACIKNNLENARALCEKLRSRLALISSYPEVLAALAATPAAMRAVFAPTSSWPEQVCFAGDVDKFVVWLSRAAVFESVLWTAPSASKTAPSAEIALALSRFATDMLAAKPPVSTPLESRKVWCLLAVTVAVMGETAIADIAFEHAGVVACREFWASAQFANIVRGPMSARVLGVAIAHGLDASLPDKARRRLLRAVVETGCCGPLQLLAKAGVAVENALAADATMLRALCTGMRATGFLLDHGLNSMLLSAGVLGPVV